MRIAILGPVPYGVTAYSGLMAYLMRACREMGHDVAGFAFALREGAISWEGMPLYPRLFDPMGQDMAMHARHFGADLVIPIMDMQNIQLEAWEGIRLAPWFPVDSFPISPYVQAIAERVCCPVVYSKFGQAEARKVGLDVAYIPCPVDTSVFAPMERSAARAALGWPQERYIVGMVQANVGRPSRKAFYPQLRAFKEFQQAHPDALLYLHTFLNIGRETDGENLAGMLESLGLEIGRDVIIADQYHYPLGLPQSYLNLAYNGMDVLLQVTTGEGFGMPLIEAQAAGTPIITGDWTAMAELCFGGWLVGRNTDDEVWGTLGGLKIHPRVSSIRAEVEKAYQDRDNPSLRARARSGALAYDGKKIAADYWKPLLGRVEAMFGEVKVNSRVSLGNLVE